MERFFGLIKKRDEFKFCLLRIVYDFGFVSNDEFNGTLITPVYLLPH